HGNEGAEVLFDTVSMPHYGNLSKRNLDDQQAGARVEVKDHKRNPADFVLWKQSNDTEPGWEAEFAGTRIYGRPGWHIECSVMAKHHLGEVFDIHGGGLDLIFPHHENEIAQSCCAHETDRMANVWMHNGFLQVEGKKMSKSLGNFFTIHQLMNTTDFGGRKWPPEVLRLAMLMTHYREPIDFSVRRLEEAENRLHRWLRLLAENTEQAPLLSNRFIGKLADDLNTVEALSVIGVWEGYAKGTLRYERGGRPASGNSTPEDAISYIRGALTFLGLPTKMRSIAEGKEASVQASITQRLAAIADKNWAEADRIRDELLAQGIQLKDGKDSETGERVTKWEVVR
ncbi:MAG: class I tRNA ligase family protein, partial [Pseudomonadota bacterium]